MGTSSNLEMARVVSEFWTGTIKYKKKEWKLRAYLPNPNAKEEDVKKVTGKLPECLEPDKKISVNDIPVESSVEIFFQASKAPKKSAIAYILKTLKGSTVALRIKCLGGLLYLTECEPSVCFVTLTARAQSFTISNLFSGHKILTSTRISKKLMR